MPLLNMTLWQRFPHATKSLDVQRMLQDTNTSAKFKNTFLKAKVAPITTDNGKRAIAETECRFGFFFSLQT